MDSKILVHGIKGWVDWMGKYWLFSFDPVAKDLDNASIVNTAKIYFVVVVHSGAFYHMHHLRP